MKITQDVREYAAQKEIYEQAALGFGMNQWWGDLSSRTALD